MTPRHRARFSGAAVVAGTALLPLLGAWIAGKDLSALRQFPPPLRIPAEYVRFAWPAVVLVLSPVAAITGSWMLASRRAARPGAGDHAVAAVAPSPFPPWGWLALSWTAIWWFLAWTRFPWFAPLQRQTFFPLWLGFIVAVNALAQARTGSCQMVRAPRRWLALFAASAVFWWVFEWLNRFTLNWHYLGVADYGPVAYALNATLCFSTVLPAVSAVRELLAGSTGIQANLASGPRFRWMRKQVTGFVLLCGGLAALVGTGADPTRFYAALWAAPLALLLAAEILGRRSGVTSHLSDGDWTRVGSWAIAALLCGFFWELWNLHSAAKWIYTVPYADRWHLFEMPLLGYIGYLPFGLECALVADWILGRDEHEIPGRKRYAGMSTAPTVGW